MTKEEAISILENEKPFNDKILKYSDDILILALDMAIEALKREPKTEWIPVSEYGYPKPEDEYKHFLVVDNKGEITIQEFLLSLDEEPQPYFTGWRNVIAWMPLPEPYKGE